MTRRTRDEWSNDDRRPGRPRRKHQSKQKQTNAVLRLVLIGGGVGLVVIVGIVILAIALGRGGTDVSGSTRDPKFDQVQRGMTEGEVIELLGDAAYIRVPGASGCWTYPRLTLEEFHQNPNRNRDIEDVITIYFRDGKVVDTYRQTGAEFRRPRPK
jgi:hypothetical protein